MDFEVKLQYKQKDQTEDSSLFMPNSIAVDELYLSHSLDDDDQKAILITSITTRYTIVNKIPLKLEHSDNFGLIQLSYTAPCFHDYFLSNSIVKVSKILLKKSSVSHKDTHDGDWDIKHIITKKESDCDYLFKKAIEDNHTVILAIQLEIVSANNSSQKLTLYPKDSNGTPLHHAVNKRDLKMIEALLLDYQLDVNEKNKTDWTPLLTAVHLNISNVVDFLISNGANVNARNNMHQVPLHFAVKKYNLKILKSLLESQAKLDEQDESGETPL